MSQFDRGLPLTLTLSPWERELLATPRKIFVAFSPAPCGEDLRHPKGNRRGEGFSLSRRERAGVRGNGVSPTRRIRTGSTPLAKRRVFLLRIRGFFAKRHPCKFTLASSR